MSFFRVATMASLLMLAAGNAFGVERVGSTVSAQDTIEGQGAVGDRQIATADPIYRDEKLRANETGLHNSSSAMAPSLCSAGMPRSPSINLCWRR